MGAVATPDSARLAVLIDSDNTTTSWPTSPRGDRQVRNPDDQARVRRLDHAAARRLEGADAPERDPADPAVRLHHGKNSTDSALIIDAMDLLYGGNVEGFVIVSSDSDFTRLATRLRESGMTVYGLGAARHPRHSSPPATGSSIWTC